MALRSWPPRTLRRIWLFGLAAELLMIGGAYTLGRLTGPPEPPALRALRLYQDSLDRGLVPPPRQLTRTERETALAILRDSLGISWQTRGGTTHVQLPPELERGVTRVARGFGSAIGVALVVAAALFLPIPIALVTVTLVWLVARRRNPVAAPAA
jgi:hypothetical protein